MLQYESIVTEMLVALSREKQSNLIVSADVTTMEALHQLLDAVAPYVVAIKIHSDIIVDVDYTKIMAFKEKCDKMDVLLFEDRKLADIGHTMEQQLVGGAMRIADWADMVTVHAIAGLPAVQALDTCLSHRHCALIVIADLSCQGHLMDDHYREATLDACKPFTKTIIGMVSQQPLPKPWLHFMPGISLKTTQDDKGQRYRGPQEAMAQGADFLIVGRDIYQDKNPGERASFWQQSVAPLLPKG